MVVAEAPKPVAKPLPESKPVVSRGDSGLPDELTNYKVVRQLSNFTMTFYDLCRKCTGRSNNDGYVNGIKMIPWKMVAVDFKYLGINRGTYLYIEGYGVVQAIDTGSAIRGRHIDMFTDLTHEQNLKLGRKTGLKVLVLEKR